MSSHGKSFPMPTPPLLSFKQAELQYAGVSDQKRNYQLDGPAIRPGRSARRARFNLPWCRGRAPVPSGVTKLTAETGLVGGDGADRARRAWDGGLVTSCSRWTRRSCGAARSWPSSSRASAAAIVRSPRARSWRSRSASTTRPRRSTRAPLGREGERESRSWRGTWSTRRFDTYCVSAVFHPDYLSRYMLSRLFAQSVPRLKLSRALAVPANLLRQVR